MVTKLLTILQTAENIQIFLKTFSRTQFLFNFQNFGIKIFAKPLFTEKKYLKNLKNLLMGKKFMKNQGKRFLHFLHNQVPPPLRHKIF